MLDGGLLNASGTLLGAIRVCRRPFVIGGLILKSTQRLSSGVQVMNQAVGGLDRGMPPVPTSRGTAAEWDFTNLSIPCSARTRPLFT